jgi:hypothetical protein
VDLPKSRTTTSPARLRRPLFSGQHDGRWSRCGCPGAWHFRRGFLEAPRATLRQSAAEVLAWLERLGWSAA